MTDIMNRWPVAGEIWLDRRGNPVGPLEARGGPFNYGAQMYHESGAAASFRTHRDLVEPIVGVSGQHTGPTFNALLAAALGGLCAAPMSTLEALAKRYKSKPDPAMLAFGVASEAMFRLFDVGEGGHPAEEEEEDGQ